MDIKAKHLDNISGIGLAFQVNDNVEKGIVVCTDQSTAYATLGKRYSHLRVNHSIGEFASGIANTNSIECIWFHLKRGIDGIYHWVRKSICKAILRNIPLDLIHEKLAPVKDLI